jgi:hypothetical protein
MNVAIAFLTQPACESQEISFDCAPRTRLAREKQNARGSAQADSAQRAVVAMASVGPIALEIAPGEAAASCRTPSLRPHVLSPAILVRNAHERVR